MMGYEVSRLEGNAGNESFEDWLRLSFRYVLGQGMGASCGLCSGLISEHC